MPAPSFLLLLARHDGVSADEIVAIMAKYSVVKDPVLRRTMSTRGCDPDGRLNIDSPRKDVAFIKEAGELTGPVSVGYLRNCGRGGRRRFSSQFDPELTLGAVFPGLRTGFHAVLTPL